MIMHKIEDKSEAWVREEKVCISKNEVQRIRALLDIENYEDWDDAKRENLASNPILLSTFSVSDLTMVQRLTGSSVTEVTIATMMCCFSIRTVYGQT